MWLFKSSVFSLVILLSMVSFSSSDRKTKTNRRTGGRTVTQAPSPCVCVPYYYCNSDNVVITNGQGLIDIRQARASTGMDSDMQPVCEDYLQVCCRLPDSTNISPKCGLRHANKAQHLIPRLDKEEAENGEFPWMVTIFRKETLQHKNETEEMKVYQCQGTLINERVVLTTAQCIAPRNQSVNSSGPLVIRVGQFDTMTTHQDAMFQERVVQQAIVHKKYNPIRLQNNVALLVVETPVIINRFVDITCLAEHGDIILKDKCVAIGWDKYLGPEHAKTQRSQTNLMKKRLEPYVHTADCTTHLRSTPLGRKFKLDNSSICAGGYPGKNFCSREIGGPLSCPLSNDPTRYVQVGVASWCINSGILQTPSIFASVAHVRGWIDNQMAKLHLDASVYRATTQ